MTRKRTHSPLPAPPLGECPNLVVSEGFGSNEALPQRGSGEGASLYLSLGSNLGDREQTLHRAIALIGERIGTVQRVSSFIETEPWGFQSEHPFLNAACMVLTKLSPMQCLEATQQIERELGRRTKSRDGIYHDRPIDIDLLLYGNLHLSTPTLTLPHPRMLERDFVMIPLREIMGDAEALLACHHDEAQACDEEGEHQPHQ